MAASTSVNGTRANNMEEESMLMLKESKSMESGSTANVSAGSKTELPSTDKSLICYLIVLLCRYFLAFSYWKFLFTLYYLFIFPFI